MPHPPKRASQAKAQRLPGNLTFTKIIKEEEGLYAFRNSVKRLMLPISTIDICIPMILGPKFGLK